MSKGRSWTPLALPYVEQTAAGAMWDFSQPWTDSAISKNATISQMNFSLFVCPSAPAPGQRPAVSDPGYPSFVGKQLGAGDYGGVTGVSPKFYSGNGLVAPADTSGILQATDDTPLLMVTDGLSNTILLAETAGHAEQYYLSTNSGTVFAAGSGGYGWADPDMNFKFKGVQSNGQGSNGGPCAINCNNNSELYSFHTGGINATIGDGSVRFITKSIALSQLGALGTARGGEADTGP